MPHPNIVESEAVLAEIVRGAKTIAVIGMKDEREPLAPAHEIPAMLKTRGMRVIPVNPKLESALGEKAFASLAEVGAPVDIVDVFRRSEAIAAVADEVLALPPGLRPAVLWMQTGIRDDTAAARLAEAGVRVVQDRCLGVYAARYR